MGRGGWGSPCDKEKDEKCNKNAKEKFPQMEGEFLSTQLLPIIQILKGDNYVIMPLCVVGAEE